MSQRDTVTTVSKAIKEAHDDSTKLTDWHILMICFI